jgi:hypothetical protein
MIYRHYSDNKNSPFGKLSGDIQRAIETQANIDVEAHKQSKYHGKAIKDEEIEFELFKALCKQYALKSEKELQRLVILDSKALYYYPLTKDRMAYYEKLAKEKADSMDRNIISRISKHFKDFSK